MKGVLFLKTLRQVHYLKKLSRSLTSKYEEDKVGKEEEDLIDHDDDEDDDIDDDNDDELSVDSMELDALVENLGDVEDNEDDDDDVLINYDLRLNLSMDDERLSKHRDDFIEHATLDVDNDVDMNADMDVEQRRGENCISSGSPVPCSIELINES